MIRGYVQTYPAHASKSTYSNFESCSSLLHDLAKNPCSKGCDGKAKAKEMLFWTKDEYTKFADVIKDKPISYYAFEILYWTGVRMSEMLALERGDINLKSEP